MAEEEGLTKQGSLLRIEQEKRDSIREETGLLLRIDIAQMILKVKREREERKRRNARIPCCFRLTLEICKALRDAAEKHHLKQARVVSAGMLHMISMLSTTAPNSSYRVQVKRTSTKQRAVPVGMKLQVGLLAISKSAAETYGCTLSDIVVAGLNHVIPVLNSTEAGRLNLRDFVSNKCLVCAQEEK